MHVFLRHVSFRATAELPTLSRPLKVAVDLATWEEADTATLFAVLTFTAQSKADGPSVLAEVHYGCRGYAESGPALTLLLQRVVAEMAALLTKGGFTRGQVSPLLPAALSFQGAFCG